MNTIVSIGYLGDKRCYLNVSVEEARRRYLEAEPDADFDYLHVMEFTFDDEFSAYEVWR